MTDYDKLYAESADVCGAPFSEFVAFFEALTEPIRVLDLGCGQGRDALVAARLGHDVVAVDLAPSGVAQLVEVAAAEGLSVKGEVGDMATYEPTGMFQVIVLDRVLHMLSSDELRAGVLSQCAAHVSEGGHILVADTSTNLPMIEAFFVTGEQAETWGLTLNRKGYRFYQRAKN